MSVVFVILSFVLICLILVHINLHQKRKELYDFIATVNKTLMKRHKKIAKLVKLLEEDELTKDIKSFNEKILCQIQNNELQPSQGVKAEILIEEKMKKLLKSLEGKELSQEVTEAIESYKKTQSKVEKNKAKYNKMISEFMEACNIQLAALYTTFENIDTDFPKLSAS